MIECALTVSHIRKGEQIYAGDSIFETDENDQQILAQTIMEAMALTFFDMAAHSVRSDYKKIDQKGIDVTIANGNKEARFCLRHNRGDDPVTALDAMLTWLHGDVVKEVIA